MVTVKVIIGGNAGDEGKGLVTDYFAAQASLSNKRCLVVLANGGSQRGHTVTLPDGRTHIFKHFGSGTYLGCSTYLPKYYVVNPMNFKKEFLELVNEKITIPLVHIHPDCLLSTPFDMIANMIIEDARGDQRHGSCGAGIWETILRDGITVWNMTRKSDSAKEAYLRSIRDLYFRNRILSKGVHISADWERVINSDNLIKNYIRDFNFMMRHSWFAEDDIMEQFEFIVFENGQGLLLDQNQDDNKYTTPSNTGLKNPAEMIKTLKNPNVEVCYVTRTYLTRHGKGPLENECGIDELNKGNKRMIRVDENNVWNQYQGDFRYAPLDFATFEQRVNSDFDKFGQRDWNKSLFFTHVNEFSDLPWKKISNNYKIYRSFSKTREAVRGNI
jgi:adenylosuccinate synthase